MHTIQERPRVVWLQLLGGALLSLLAGCASTPGHLDYAPVKTERLLPAEIENRAEAVRRNPVAYLHKVAENCRGLNQYTLTFTRHERRGLFKRMYGPEHIVCWFRRDPFSVRMKWLDEDVKYLESAFVEGQHDNKVRFVNRWWSPPMKPPPGINEVDLQTPVTFGESLRPMTHFGLERMMERTLASLEKAGNDVIVSYEGTLELPDDGRLVHHIHLEYPHTQHKVPIQELYVDIATDLPAGTVLRLPSGKLNAAYFYAAIDSNVELTGEDFLLDAERQARQAVQPAADEQ